MYKAAVAMIAFAGFVSAQEVAFQDIEQFCEESEFVATDEALVQEEDSEEIVLLEDDVVSDVEEETFSEEE